MTKKDNDDARAAGLMPRALALTARAYRKDPRKLGLIVLALNEGCEAPRGFDEGMEVALGLCREELATTAQKRERERTRKARSRAAAKAE